MSESARSKLWCGGEYRFPGSATPTHQAAQPMCRWPWGQWWRWASYFENDKYSSFIGGMYGIHRPTKCIS